MRIAVVGTGYVGLVTGTCLAEVGHTVTCVDLDERKVKMPKEAKSPIYEPGLEPLIQHQVLPYTLLHCQQYLCNQEIP